MERTGLHSRETRSSLKTSTHWFFFSYFCIFSWPLCWQLFFETRSVPTIWFFFFGTVNPKTDLNFKEQLPRWWTCWLNVRFSLFADEADSVCILLTLLRALFATYGMLLFCSLFLFFLIFSSPVRSRTSHRKPLDSTVSSCLSTFHHISTVWKVIVLQISSIKTVLQVGSKATLQI